MADSVTNPIHLLIIPFPAKGHIIPLLDLTRRLLTHYPNHVTVTFLTTPSSFSLLQPLLSIFPPSLLQPLNLSLPPPSSPQTSIVSKIRAFHTLSDPIISSFNSHPSPPSVILFDFFCTWVNSLSSTLNLPRVVFYAAGASAASVFHSLWRVAPSNPEDDPDLVTRFDDVPGSPEFKWNELSMLFRCGKEGDSDWELFRGELMSNLKSWGVVFNSFTELEQVYFQHFMKELGHDRVWAVGPLLPSEDNTAHRGGTSSLEVLTWLDGKPDGSVVYICFGSRTSLTVEESTVLAEGLRSSNVHFIWCVQGSDVEEGIMPNRDFEDQMVDKGFIIRGWAPQLAILRHRAVGSFVTHCGWNSVLESISSGVMMLAWPMGADQYSNAQLVIERLGLGLRIQCDGRNGVPNHSELAQLLANSVSSAQPERDQVMRMRDMAVAAASSGGSSTIELDKLVKHLSDLN